MQPTPEAEVSLRRYHHGDLRNALVQAGLRLIETRPADELGLRELAREVGVSATAIYRHFPDKQALMAALAQAGLALLAQAQQQASAQAGGGAAGFRASGMTYVRFAAEHPALFRLVFSHAPSDDLLDGAPDSVPAAMRGLREHVARLLPPQATDAQRKTMVLHAWALVHGLALLLLDRQITPDWALFEQMLSGLAGPLQAPH